MAGSVVQSFIATGSGVTSLSHAFPVNTTAGNDIVSFCVDGSASGHTLTPSDTSNTYTKPDTLNDTTNGNTCASGNAVNIAGGADTLKWTDSATASISFFGIEVTGVTSSPLDGHNVGHNIAPGTGTDAISSGSVTNSNTAFAVGFCNLLHDAVISTPAAGTGFTSTSGTNITVVGFGNNEARIEWKASVASGTHTNGVTFTDASGGGSDNYVTFAVYLDESGAAAAPFKPIDTDERIFLKPSVTDFAPPNLLALQILKLPPFTQENDGARTFWKGVYTDFAPPNLLTQQTLKLPPFTQEELPGFAPKPGVFVDFTPPNLLTQQTLKLPPFTQEELPGWMPKPGVFTDFSPPNLLADKFLPPPPVASVDLSQQVQFKWSATDFLPPNLLTLTLPKPPIVPQDWNTRITAKGIWSDFYPENLILSTLLPVTAPNHPQDMQGTFTRGVYEDFSPPDLILNTLAPPPPAPLLPQDISGIRIEARGLSTHWDVPNLTLFLPIPPPITIHPAGRHKSRAEAHRRWHKDVLRARVEALKAQRKAAEEALENYETREVRERTKVLTKIRVRPGKELHGLRKPLEQYAPVKKAIAQRTDSLANYRAILQHLARAQSEYEAHLAEADEEAALHFMHFLMWEAHE